jgi:hypothetical protein
VWGVRSAWREIIIGICGVIHMPQTYDGSLLVPFSVRVRADERNCGGGGGSRFERNGATSCIGARGSEQKSQYCQGNKGAEVSPA